MPFKESLADFISGGALTRARESASIEARGSAHFQERALDLEAAVKANAGESRAWQIITGTTPGLDVSNQSLSDLRSLARYLYLKNPLINRGVHVQADYVFGLGVTVRCEEKTAQLALEAFWDDEGNRKVLTEPHALVGREIAQQVDGETFFIFFTNRITGHVRIRTAEADSISEVVTNPEDKFETWFYKRTWSAATLDLETGRAISKTQTAYYPDWRYNPAKKPTTIGGKPVFWDTPIYHVKTGGLPDMTRGVSELLCQLDWAQAYTNFLENRATVAKALSRFVLQVQTKTKEIASAVRTAMSGPTPNDIAKGTNGRDRAGQVAMTGEGQKIEAVSIKGATINPDEGRRFLLMVAAGAGLPETFYGDASVGSLATAQSLDRPTELMMEKRRLLWQGVLTNIATYVLLAAIRAPLNPLKRKVTYHGTTPRIALAEGKALEVKVEFPPLLEHDVPQRVTAINNAADRLPFPRLIASLLMQALGVKDQDEYLKDLPEFREPEPEATPPNGSADEKNDKAKNAVTGDKTPAQRAASTREAQSEAEAKDTSAIDTSDVIEAFREAAPELRDLMAALNPQSDAV